MKTCKQNPLKLNETRFLADVHNKEGRYVKRYFFSNGLGASVVCHDGSYGGHAGFFELALMKYKLGSDPEITSKIIYDTETNKDLGVNDVLAWLDFHDVAAKLIEIRNYNTGEYAINE